MGAAMQEIADYFDHCRARRNTVDYDRAGTVAEAEVDELLAEARGFRAAVLDWLSARHPRLRPESSLEGESQ
jgi:hypothetical protein